MIVSGHFNVLLDSLAGQFFKDGEALCAGSDFGIQLSLAAKDYFSVAVITDRLPKDIAVLGVLLDDSVNVPSRREATLS